MAVEAARGGRMPGGHGYHTCTDPYNSTVVLPPSSGAPTVENQAQPARGLPNARPHRPTPRGLN
jgi:hypothetical protein